MSPTAASHWIAFAQRKRIALGPARDVAVAVKGFADGHPETPVMVLDATTCWPVELDLRGSVAAVLKRLPPAPDDAPASPDEAAAEQPARGPGRPKLGVVAREVTLLPRHWDWLATQPGGASVALRKLVEQARRTHRESDRLREAKEAAYRFMAALAGNEEGFEEASRALFADDLVQLKSEVAKWPRDVRLHVVELASRSVAGERADTGSTGG